MELGRTSIETLLTSFSGSDHEIDGSEDASDDDDRQGSDDDPNRSRVIGRPMLGS